LPNLNEQIARGKITSLSDPALAGKKFTGRGIVLFTQSSGDFVYVYVDLTGTGYQPRITYDLVEVRDRLQAAALAPDIEVIALRQRRDDGSLPASDQIIAFNCRFVRGQGYHAELLSWWAQ
jgi:hypothetical protein